MSNNDNILKISKLYKNAVAKLTALNNEVDVAEPFTLTNECNEEVCGSGFFIKCTDLYLPREMSHKRYLISNAHVIEGSSTKRISISFPHLGDTILYGKVILACKGWILLLWKLLLRQITTLKKNLENLSSSFQNNSFCKNVCKTI